jgi:hypothetical protein
MGAPAHQVALVKKTNCACRLGHYEWLMSPTVEHGERLKASYAPQTKIINKDYI